MTGKITQKLTELGITLPEPPAPAGNYVPAVITGNLIFISGQLPFGPNGIEFIGKVGAEVTMEEAQAAARLCAINMLAHIDKTLAGGLDAVTRCVKLGGFVAATPDFIYHPQVINGASDLMAEIFGEAGKHARFAVGLATLPLNAPVEVDGVFEFK